MDTPSPETFMASLQRDVVEKRTMDSSTLRPGDLRLNTALDRLEKKIAEDVFTIEGKTYDRGQVMEYMFQRMTEGRNPISKVEFCRLKGAPTLRQVAAWERNYPSFADELHNAERIVAELLAWKSVDVTLDESDPKAGGLVKAKAESLRWMASKLDTKRFADRKIEEKEDSLSKASIQELMDTFKNALVANVDLIKELSHDERQQFIDAGIIEAEIVQPAPAESLPTDGTPCSPVVHTDEPEGETIR